VAFDELALDFSTDAELLPTEVALLSDADEVAELAADVGRAGRQSKDAAAASEASEAGQGLNWRMRAPQGRLRRAGHLIAAAAAGCNDPRHADFEMEVWGVCKSQLSRIFPFNFDATVIRYGFGAATDFPGGAGVRWIAPCDAVASRFTAATPVPPSLTSVPGESC